MHGRFDMVNRLKEWLIALLLLLATLALLPYDILTIILDA